MSIDTAKHSADIGTFCSAEHITNYTADQLTTCKPYNSTIDRSQQSAIIPAFHMSIDTAKQSAKCATFRSAKHITNYTAFRPAIDASVEAAIDLSQQPTVSSTIFTAECEAIHPA